MALDPSSDNDTTRDLGRTDRDLMTLALVIAGAIVIMAAVRFQPKLGGWVLLAVTLLLLRNLFEGGRG